MIDFKGIIYLVKMDKEGEYKVTFSVSASEREKMVVLQSNTGEVLDISIEDKESNKEFNLGVSGQ